MIKMLKIDVETHKKLKVLAAEASVTMKELVAKMVEEKSNGK